MSIKLKTYTGGEVTAKDDAILFDTIIGTSGIVYGCEVTSAGSNKLNVATGKLLIKGRQIDITEQTVLATLASSGSQKGRLLVHVDLSNTSEPVKFVTQVGSTLPDLEQDEDFNNSNGVYEYELAYYTVSATAVLALAQSGEKIGTSLASLKDGTIKVYATTTSLAVTGSACIGYVDVTAPITGKFLAAVPVIINREDWTAAKTPIGVALQDKEAPFKKRIIVTATREYTSVTVKIYWFYIGTANTMGE